MAPRYTHYIIQMQLKKIRGLTMANFQQICSIVIPNASGDSKQWHCIYWQVAQLRRREFILC